MYYVWVVIKLECRLIWSSRITWALVLIMFLNGALCATANRNAPWQSWFQIQNASFFLSLILAFCTGNQINRDREQRLAGIVLSTPVATTSYVLGKYLAGLVSLLMLAGVSLLAALLLDHFYASSHAFLLFPPAFYPPLGTLPYLIGWVWLVLPAIIFGATFMLAGMTLTGGQRVIAYLAVLLIWVLPRFLAGSMPKLLDITATVFYPQFSLAPASHASGSSPLMQFLLQHPSLFGNGPPPATLVPQVMQLALAETPPSPLPSLLLWNRFFFLGLSVLLLLLTIFGTQVLRRHA
jgi:ABC-type transport system involved in multi-copper enzyme maturation permease subunit